ncbi:hypothetical protein CDAR_506931 [Caerostris darwini]|uniref:Uncharacterized protein n=1 Tax=Caerostris darwini TaxID=1538125 RepID=A0AAV4P2T1_9ARAC|nr:hypothetical protein CDAR_506931 [Caerostris darwini]
MKVPLSNQNSWLCRYYHCSGRSIHDNQCNSENSKLPDNCLGRSRRINLNCKLGIYNSLHLCFDGSTVRIMDDTRSSTQIMANGDENLD